MTGDRKREAAVSLALARCRGVLYSVMQGEIDMDEIEQIIESTSLENIAAILGAREMDFVDWSEVLSKKEINEMEGIQ